MSLPARGRQVALAAATHLAPVAQIPILSVGSQSNANRISPATLPQTKAPAHRRPRSADPFHHCTESPHPHMYRPMVRPMEAFRLQLRDDPLGDFSVQRGGGTLRVNFS